MAAGSREVCNRFGRLTSRGRPPGRRPARLRRVSGHAEVKLVAEGADFSVLPDLSGDAPLLGRRKRRPPFCPPARAPGSPYEGIVTLPCEERQRTIRGYGFSCGREDLAPRAHRNGAEHAVRLS